MGTELWSLNPQEYLVGPYDLRLPGPIKLCFGMDGEKIISVQIERGYLHRGLEKIFELLPWQSGVFYSDRVDGENAFFGEWVYCKAVEELLSLQIPKRAKMIRIILAELSRVQSHLLCFHHIARSVQAGSFSHFVLRDREKILDLFELISGARLSLGILRIGGIAHDVTEGFLERVLEVCDYIRGQMNEYNDIFSFNSIFIDRSIGKGIFTKREVIEKGITGVCARATGLPIDYRTQDVSSEYEGFDFEIPIAHEGDSYSRYLVRIKEITESLNIIRQAVDGLPAGEFLNPIINLLNNDRIVVPAGEAYVRVESPRGLLACTIMSEGLAKPSRVQFRTPSLLHFFSLDNLLIGLNVEDIGLVLASLDLSISEIDR